MKIRYLIRKYTNPDFKRLEETAYHEAGHVLFSYVADFSVDRVSIDPLKPGNGKTSVNYGDVQDIVKALFALDYNASIFNNLANQRKGLFQGVTTRVMHALVAGPISEARYVALKGTFNIANVKIENSDYKMCRTLEASLKNILNNQNIFHNHNYTDNQIHKVWKMISLDELWNTIGVIAIEILGKKNYTLYNKDIHKILVKNKYYEFISTC